MTPIDPLVARFFGAFDNRDGRGPSLADVAACFVERAVIAQRIGTETRIMTVPEFAEPRIALLSSGTLTDFHEEETAGETRVHAPFATRTSDYAKSGRQDGQPFSGRGRKWFQLAEIGGAWKIVSLCWVDFGDRES